MLDVFGSPPLSSQFQSCMYVMGPYFRINLTKKFHKPHPSPNLPGPQCSFTITPNNGHKKTSKIKEIIIITIINKMMMMMMIMILIVISIMIIIVIMMMVIVMMIMIMIVKITMRMIVIEIMMTKMTITMIMMMIYFYLLLCKARKEQHKGSSQKFPLHQINK